MERYTAIDLFSGAGGLTVGLKKAGFNVLAGVEINDAAIETYRLNHRECSLYTTDIRQLSPEILLRDLSLKKGDLDLLAGCPPCQGFSTHRTRKKSNSVADERNDLIFEFVRFVSGLLPKTIMMENVPALAEDESMAMAKAKLEKLGYIFDKHSIAVRDASNYGVPQRRKRMIMLASRYGKIPAPKPATIRRTVRDAIGSLKKPTESSDTLHSLTTRRGPKAQAIISAVPKNGGSRAEIPKELWLPCHIKNPNGYRDVYGRMTWDDVAPTITGGCSQPSKGRFIHPEEDRGITLREAALLQTFPKKYKFSLSKGKDAVALMIGNALPPEFIRRQAVVLIKHLDKYA